MFSEPSLSQLAEIVQSHLGGALPALEPIATGKHNRSFWVASSQGRFVLRVAPPDSTGLLFYERRMMRQEPALHRLLRERTSIPVADVVAADFSRARLDRDYILLTALGGMPMSEVRLNTAAQAETLRQVGQCLRQLHQLTALECLGVPAYGYLGEHQVMAPQTTWWQAFHAMWNLLLDDVLASGGYTPADAERMRALLQAYQACFHHDVAPALLHMDVWAQNILVNGDGSVTGLVDFDRALWGDPEIEFAVLDYCGISEAPFWEGYGQMRDVSPDAEIRRIFYLLYEIQKYMPIAIWRRGDPGAARRYREQCLQLADQLS
jgi:fructosamine-3-kinase